MVELKDVLEPALARILRVAPSRRFPKLVSDCKALQERMKKGALTAGPDAPRPGPAPGRRPLAMHSSRALPEEIAAAAWGPLKQALDTRLPRVMEPALDALQRLIAAGYLCGDADVLGGRADDDGSSIAAMEGRRDSGRTPAESAAAPNPGVAKSLAGEAVEAVCWACDLQDEKNELLVLKAILTAATSCTFLVHGESLLRCTRTCYNVFLGSRSHVNQMAAKATLTQMLTMVFRRMEADSPAVPATAIAVAELVLEAPEEKRLGEAAVLSSVQAIMNRVVEDITATFATARLDDLESFSAETPQGIKPAAAAAAAAAAAEASAQAAAAGGGAAGTGGVDADRGEGLGATESSCVLRRDAFLVLRMLCKLSMKAAGETAQLDAIVEKGKLVSLHLVRILLDNAGPVFRSHPRFLAVLREHLALSLLRNAASPAFQPQSLAVAIFATLLARFRPALKPEVGVFLPLLLLRSLEAPPGPPPGGLSYRQRAIVLRVLRFHSQDASLLVDLFVNYDCDVESTNLFERLVSALVRLAQGAAGGPDSGLSPAEDVALRLESQLCVVNVLRALAQWLDKPPPPPAVAAATAEGDGDLLFDGAEDGDDSNIGESAAGGGDAGGGGGESVREGSGAEGGKKASLSAEEMKRHKTDMLEGIALFNKKPKKGIEHLMKLGKLGPTPEDVAAFLRATSGLNKTLKGDYLGEREDFNLKVMHAYVDAMSFAGQSFDEAIRAFLDGFRLPGEAQKIDRLMEKFAERYCKDNPGSFKSADTAYVLAYSVIMLNTDAHNPQVKVKMTKEGFLRNNRGIDDGADLPPDFMGHIYERIVGNEIRMKGEPGDADTPAVAARKKEEAARSAPAFLGIPIVPSKAQLAELRLSETEEAVRATLELVRDRARRGAPWRSEAEADTAVPMLQSVWAPALAALGIQFETEDNPERVALCLEGFRCGARVACAGRLESVREQFVGALAKYAQLAAPYTMRPKHMKAFLLLLAVSLAEGDGLGDSWVHALRGLSRMDYIVQLARGGVTDNLLFAGSSPLKPPTTDPAAVAAVAARGGSPAAPGAGGGAPGPGRLDRSQSGRRMTNSGLVVDVVAAAASAGLLPPAGVLDMLPPEALDRVWLHSASLGSEAIVDFVRALCFVSLEELQAAGSPRIYCLTKLVEVAHYNTGRIRLVWSRLWAVLTDYFVAVGCHPNLSVAIYVVDSLRQLAMKFLEREELANYSFQNVFLRPFVVLMKQSTSVPVREFIIRCINQMVLARVASVKSGWRSMFQVFTVAAGDREPAIVSMAFETIEKIVRDHFKHITATEVGTFTDCVNCLLAFTGVRNDLMVSLNAIAFLRFCAIQLAEGELGPPPGTALPPPPGPMDDGVIPRAAASGALASPATAESAAATRAAEVHTFWFPLLAGLAELSFDPREEVRETAAGILFDTLKFHGHQFSLAFWEKVFDAVLVPMADHVRPDILADPASAGWLLETAARCVRLVIELYVAFYATIAPLLPRVLAMLGGLIRRPHAALAAVGVDALGTFLDTSGHLFDDAIWDAVLRALRAVIGVALPDVAHLVAPATWAFPLDAAESAARRSPTEPPVVESMAGRSPAAWRRAESEVATRAATQLRLVAVVGGLYARHGRRLSRPRLASLMDGLVAIHAYARGVNGDRAARERLRYARAAAGPPLPAGALSLPDPPLYELEAAAGSAYLAMLMHNWSSWYLSASEDEARVESRLVEFCASALAAFAADATAAAAAEACRPAPGGPSSSVLTALHGAEVGMRAPVAVAVLKALQAFSDEAFARHLTTFFPLLTALISCELAPPEVTSVLAQLFQARVGPLLTAHGGSAAAK